MFLSLHSLYYIHTHIQGIVEYLIKWEGYSDECNSWIPEDDVFCKEKIDAYEASLTSKSPIKRSLRSHCSEAKKVKDLNENGNTKETGMLSIDGYDSRLDMENSVRVNISSSNVANVSSPLANLLFGILS